MEIDYGFSFDQVAGTNMLLVSPLLKSLFVRCATKGIITRNDALTLIQTYAV